MKDNFDAAFVAEIISYALDIALRQRGENHLQNAETLCIKFDAEMLELASAENIWDEIPDVLYYAVCLVGRGISSRLATVEQDILPKYGVSVSIRDAKIACRAKYARRAAGHPKDVLAERQGIMDALSTRRKNANAMLAIERILTAHEQIGCGVLDLQIAVATDPTWAEDVTAMQPEIEAFGEKLADLVQKARAKQAASAPPFDANDLVSRLGDV